jgi:hypothetical protein
MYRSKWAGRRKVTVSCSNELIIDLMVDNNCSDLDSCLLKKNLNASSSVEESESEPVGMSLDS